MNDALVWIKTQHNFEGSLGGSVSMVIGFFICSVGKPYGELFSDYEQ